MCPQILSQPFFIEALQLQHLATMLEGKRLSIVSQAWRNVLCIFILHVCSTTSFEFSEVISVLLRLILPSNMAAVTSCMSCAKPLYWKDKTSSKNDVNCIYLQISIFQVPVILYHCKPEEREIICRKITKASEARDEITSLSVVITSYEMTMNVGVSHYWWRPLHQELPV